MDGATLNRLFLRDFPHSRSELGCVVQHILEQVRSHFGFGAAFVSETRDGESQLLCIDRRADFSPLLTCGKPLPDTPLSTQIAVPLLSPKGQVTGHLGLLSRTRTIQLAEADMRLVRAAAELIAGHTAVIERLETAPLPSAPTRHTTKKQPPHPHPDHLPTTSGGGPISRSLHRALSYPARQTVAPSAVALPIAVAQTLVSGRIGIDFQPIRALSDLRIAGYEGLARFPDIHGTSVQSIFDAARAGGLGPELELQALRRAVEASQNRPPEGVFIALNLSYRTLVCDMLQAMYERDCVGLPREGYIIEISEAEAIENFSMLREALVPIRAAGMKLAIDDVGAGQSGLRHILLLEPDMIKIDKSVTAELVERKASRAMIAALTSFGEQTDCDIVAEGVETPAQLRILQDLGTPMGQGYLLGRPCALPNTDILYEQRRGKLGGL